MNRRDPQVRKNRTDYDFNNNHSLTTRMILKTTMTTTTTTATRFRFVASTIVVTRTILKAVENLKSIPTMESTTRTISGKG